MNLTVSIKIALKYLWRYRRRYLFLFLALGFGFGVLTTISSLKDGMKENLYLSAQSHYAGDVIALGFDPDLYSKINNYMTKTEQDAIFASAEAVSLDPASVAVRTSLYGVSKGQIHFNGNAAPILHLVGLDWEAEKNYIEQLPYTGSLAPLDHDSILLSRPIADELGAKQNDSIILEVLTRTGQKNTGLFVVKGIVDDTNSFSYYKVFVLRRTLNRLIGIEDDDCSFIGFFLKNRKQAEKKRKELHDVLQNRVPTAPIVHDRDNFYNERDKLGSGISVILITLPVYLSEVAELLTAIDLASYVLFIMMLAIIMVSAVVTCALILHERTRETGTMRAIGFYESDLRHILQLEMAVMALVSMTAGFFLSMIINRVLSHGSYSWFPGFEVFMQNGHLAARYQPGTIIVNIILTGCALALAIGGPIFRNSRSPLPEMLSGGSI